MQVITATDPRAYTRMTTAEFRDSFLLTGLFTPGAVELRYWETDRTVVGSAVPTTGKLDLPAPRELAAKFFNERRELGILNLGAPGTVTVDGTAYALAHLDCLYVSRGSQAVSFTSADAATPAEFYLLSYPAHTAYPTTHVTLAATTGTELGSQGDANARTIYKYIHTGGIKSCQLVLGVTVLKPGSVWNTMPAHTHLRRSEVYLYFNVPPKAAVVHFAGLPQETRHLLVHDRQAALSPAWSIHSGAGTSNYSFVWGMGGENQEFSDMDGVAVRDLR